MTPSHQRRYPSGEDFEYLCADEFLQTAVDARALQSAFELGLIDRLHANPSRLPDELERDLGIDRRGLRLLLDLLRANRVIEEREGEARLTERFRVALRYRDLLEAKIDFANFVAPDFLDLFTLLVGSPGRFMQRARLFDLFNYQRCFDGSPESYELTRRWMRFTTVLTRYEARVCLRCHDFGRHRRMLDIGGNSGEFALQVCKEHPSLRAAVLDLPLVCDIGREHVGSEPEADRIRFIKGNALQDTLPAGFDLITFKSMLHDWPEDEARRLLARAWQSLDAGGTLLIFERGPIEVEATPPYAMLPMLLFFRSFRSPVVYQEELDALGGRDVEVRRIDLEMPFFLVTARKPGQAPGPKSGS